jgi:hypothetical protein
MNKRRRWKAKARRRDRQRWQLLRCAGIAEQVADDGNTVTYQFISPSTRYRAPLVTSYEKVGRLVIANLSVTLRAE